MSLTSRERAEAEGWIYVDQPHNPYWMHRDWDSEQSADWPYIDTAEEALACKVR